MVNLNEEYYSKLLLLWPLLLIIWNIQSSQGQSPCPPETKELTRVPNTRYYIYHPKKKYTFKDAKAKCKELGSGMKLAKIGTIEEDLSIERFIVNWAINTKLSSTEWWIDVKYDLNEHEYKYEYDQKSLEYHNFLYKNNPVGENTAVIGNATKETCATVGLPFPFEDAYGMQYNWIEHTCAWKTGSHILCEGPGRCNDNSADLATEEKRYDGAFPLSNRKYVISWHRRPKDQAAQYCAGLGLTLMNIQKDQDECLLNLIKRHRRDVTSTHFWTGWTYDSKTRSFKDIAGNSVGQTPIRIDVKGGAHKKQVYCISLFYAFEHHNSCNCPWKYLQTIPMVCDLPNGVICQHGITSHKVPCVYDRVFPLNETSDVFRSDDKADYASAERECRRYGLTMLDPDVVHNFEFTHDYDKEVAYYVYSPSAASEDKLCKLQMFKKLTKKWEKTASASCSEYHFYLCGKSHYSSSGGGRSFPIPSGKETIASGRSFSRREGHSNNSIHFSSFDDILKDPNYVISKTKASFKHAKHRCEEKGMELMSTDSPHAARYIEMAAYKFRRSFWIYSEAVDRANSYEEEEGHHHICVVMRKNGFPTTSKCNHHHYYICALKSF